jgi:hypothetical protein
MDPHPEVAELSALSEGLLPPDRGADVREHLAGCAPCTDVLSSLEEIRDLLGTLPGPHRMPQDIAGRIDAALAAEALLDSTTPRVPRETSLSPETPVSRGTAPRVPSGTRGAPGGRSDASTGPGRNGGSGSHRTGQDRWRSRGGIVAAAALALSGVLYVAVSGGGIGAGSSNDAGSTSVEKAVGPVATESVAKRVQQLLGPNTDSARTPMLQDNGDDTTAGPRGTITVPSCVIKAIQRSQAPLAADREPFHGTDAFLVVLPHPGDDTLVDAFFVNASCTATSPGTVLFQDTYPR